MGDQPGPPLGAEIVAVYGFPLAYLVDIYRMAPPIQYDPEWAAALKWQFDDAWCKPLRESGVPYRMVMKDGRPASVIADVAILSTRTLLWSAAGDAGV